MLNLKNKALSSFIGEGRASSSLEDPNSAVVFVGKDVEDLKLSKKDMQEIMHSYKVFRDEGEQEAASIEILEEETGGVAEEIIEEEVPALEVSEAPVISGKSKKKQKKSPFQYAKISQISPADLKAKQKALNLSLRSYIDTCVQNGMINRGYLGVIRYRWKCKKMGKNGLRVNDVFIFNQLMRGFGEKGNYVKVREVQSILKEDNIKANATTIMVFLDCLGRLSLNSELRNKNHILSEEELDQEITKVIEDAEKQNLTLDNIMNNSTFYKNQREMTLLAIRRLKPQFTPTYQMPDILYNNHLVNALNKNVQDSSYDPILNIDVKCEGSEIMESKGGFEKHQIEEWTKEQILNELNGEVQIKSCIEYPEPTPEVMQQRQRLDDLNKWWRGVIVSSFNRDFNVLRVEEFRSRGNQSLLPYLRSLEVEQYATIILNEIRRLAEGSENYSPYISQLYRILGEKVEMRYHMEQKMKLGILEKTSDIYEKYCDVMIAGNSSDNARQCWQRLVHKSNESGASVQFQPQPWSMPVKVSVGRFLYNIIIRDLKLDMQLLKTGKVSGEGIPAFFTLFRHQGRLVKEELKPHPLLIKM